MGSQSQGTGGFFRKGSLVEVTSNLDGFRGAWFVARVVKAPRSSVRRSTRKLTLVVEYLNLLSDDGMKPLRERVSFGFVRPIPPFEMHDDQTFQVNDVVDGYYNDGWWVGVVCHVWEDSKAYTVVFDDPPDSVKFRSSEVRVHLDWVDGKWIQPPKRIMQLKGVGSSSRKRKRGERPKSLLRGAFDEITVEDCTTNGLELAIIGEPTELTDSSSMAEDIGMAIVPSNMVYSDEPLSICLPTIGADSSTCDRTVNESSEGEGRLYDTVLQCDTREAAIDKMPYENQSIRLFKSSSPIWSFIQSMEVFRLMPQKPHFHPLNECNEIRREGLAIAQWINFAKVVEQTSELQIDASRSTFDSIIEFLSELESHGFDVKAVRSRLLELQTKKESQEQLQSKLENLESEILERTHKKTKIKTKLDDAIKELKLIEEKINMVNEKKTRLVSMIEQNDSTIAKLNSSDDLVNEEIQKFGLNFENLAGSPW
ncbi:hypothetical protein Dsin_026221 [Dipteronia sinensis]|uniref:Agenet domain-containing protein n=1 Tax=Dipteronia sinensis TaxID=43782 RepID=A0AAE0DXW8_9ROSI|nr:hypothetical protein Dsin_026221 [Dipteronia sinensis]